jgi:diguanylate cyclase (GGDEF)-like protein
MQQEADQYKYRNELLRQYVYLALIVSLLVAPLEYYSGMNQLAVVLNIFTLAMIYLVFSTRRNVVYVVNSRLFMVAISILFFAGFISSTQEIDNKYFLLLYPIASFSIRGVIEGIIWSSTLLLAFIVTYIIVGNEALLISHIFFAIAFFMVSYIVYYYRFYEILNFEHISQLQKEKEAESQRLTEISNRDKLTGLYNRHHLDKVLEESVELSQHRKQIFGLLLLDVDFFKSVNDSYGHQVGDELLTTIATLLRNNVRENDVIARWGGDEFMIITPGNDHEGATALAEKLCQIIEQQIFPIIGSKTVSIGVASYRQGDDSKTLIARSDEALYRAKNGGRNRIEVEK